MNPLPPRVSRRSATRREIALPCQVVRERDFRLVAERTLDVSIDGMLVPLDRSLAENVAVGDSVILSFEIPGIWVDAEGTVARIIQGRRPSDDGRACGIVFDAIGAATRAALAGYLHGRPPPLPRRGPMARMRRGLEGPRLADELVMASFLPMPELVDEADVLEDEGDDEALGILREVALAWKRLVLADVEPDAESDAG
jgi:hypothetical protein